MENKQTVFRKVAVKDRLPIIDNDYFTNVGKVHFRGRFYYWVEWWLEEIELPSEEEVDIKGYNEAWKLDNGLEENNSYHNGFMSGANYILNKLK